MHLLRSQKWELALVGPIQGYAAPPKLQIGGGKAFYSLPAAQSSSSSILIFRLRERGRVYMAASRRAQASASRICSSVGCFTTACASIVRRTISVICRKL